MIVRVALPEDRAGALEVWRAAQAGRGRRPNAARVTRAGVVARCRSAAIMLVAISAAETVAESAAIGSRCPALTEATVMGMTTKGGRSTGGSAAAG